MKRTNTVRNLALSKLRYNKSRTLLTGIAIMLTTMLLMAIGTVGTGALDMNRQMYALADYHARFGGLTPEQVNVLSNHIQVEALSTTEVFAYIENGKMNGALTYQETLKNEQSADDGSLHSVALASGHYPEAENEICSSPAFFRRVGAEPVIGGKVTLSFRVDGKGKILTREFTISGLEPDVEISDQIDDSRLMWTGRISKALLDSYEADGLYESELDATLRVYGEEELTFDEMTDRINAVAADIGLDEGRVNINKEYLFTATDPGTEAMAIMAVIGLIVIFFSSLVIYSIYYVGVITDVQEIGKLKALGASGRQIARLFYWQGAIVSAFAVPVGLLLGFLLPYLLFPLALWAYSSGSAISSYSRDAAEAVIGQLHMFSLPVLLIAAAASLITVAVSLRKPIRMAKKVSPVEAIRYQENTSDRKSRKGHAEVKVSTLTLANLTRNRKRTAVTILTMGLSCVLFICVSAVLCSVSAEDLARRSIPRGDFRIALDYALYNDKEYPENNLENLVQQEYFNDAFLARLSSIDGVESVERAPGKIISSTDMESPMYEEYENHLPLSYFTRDDVAELSACLEQGSIDYDRMTANNEIICTHVYYFNEYGMSIGDVLPITLHDGSREIPLTVTLGALTEPDSNFALLVMTEDTWNSLGLTCDPTTSIYLHVDDAHYDSVKETLMELAAENGHFTLYCMDVELAIGHSSIDLMKNPLYLLLILIAVIGFINLINTMITSIVTRKKELGILQALGLSDRQLVRMLSGEGLVFTAGTLLISLTLGNAAGYLLFLWAKDEHLMSISHYHYPLWETVGLALVLLIGQTAITLFINKKVKKESLIDRIRNEE